MPEICGGHIVSTFEKMIKYFVECPFIDPRDNKVSLETCEKCYWNNGVLTNKNMIPVKVSCQYMLRNDFPVQVMCDES